MTSVVYCVQDYNSVPNYTSQRVKGGLSVHDSLIIPMSPQHHFDRARKTEPQIALLSSILHPKPISRRRGIDKRPVNPLVTSARVREPSTGIQSHRVIRRGAHVLEVETLFCFPAITLVSSPYTLHLTPFPFSNKRYKVNSRGLEAFNAIRPSALTSHSWPGSAAASAAQSLT